MSLPRVPKRRRRGGGEDAANSRLSKQQDCGEAEAEVEAEVGEESAYEQLLASLGAGQRKRARARGERSVENVARQRRRGNRGSVRSTGQVDCQQPHRDQDVALGDPEEPNSDHEQPLSDHELNGRDGGSETAAEASGGEEDRESGDSGDEGSGDEGTAEMLSVMKDPFREHFDPELLPEEVATLEAAASPSSPPSLPFLVPALGLVSRRRGLTEREPELSFQPRPLTKVKQRLARNWKTASKPATDLQKHLFAVMSSYTDLLYTQRTFENAEEVRRVYCLHALNHVLKTRSRILKNNHRLLQAAKAGHPIEEPRDQGLTRPKVLILLPFRHSALQVVQTLTSLLTPPGQGHVHSHRRFLREFGEEKEVPGTAKVPKPSSYTAMFVGNTDDCFRVGVAVRGKVLRLFADFYSADIILASPLGLRTIIGAEGETKRDFDFLSSVELLMLDQTDVFLMQNWEHVTHVFSHLHRTPSESHGVDFSRVRLWALNEWSHFYRQTLIFSAIQTPEINSLLTVFCHNYAGCVRCDEDGRREGGIVGQVVRQVPQVFTRLSCPSHTQLPDARLHHFTSQVLPGYHGDLMKGTLVFIPSYLDFVRLRNHMKKQELSFAAISEYTTGSGVSRARTEFYHSQKHFLLYTERAHFFHRYRLRGVCHVLFYCPPVYPEHYAELVNMGEGEGGTVEVLHSRWEQLALSRIVGGARAHRISSSSDTTHMIVTGN